ncbi:MAG: hypothetical protein J3Q66DRAFT_336595 [Benniella sp.]|nr:MAG: hypothetical protein J3Q66DRAFT_336595 [Benniella sp.]
MFFFVSTTTSFSIFFTPFWVRLISLCVLSQTPPFPEPYQTAPYLGPGITNKHYVQPSQGEFTYPYYRQVIWPRLAWACRSVYVGSCHFPPPGR